MAVFKVGRVSHYYDKINVAIVDLDSDLAPGDKIRFVRGGEDLFEQDVESIQIEHEKVKMARKGDCIGIKVVKPVREGAEVFRLT
jgi:putative protease